MKYIRTKDGIYRAEIANDRIVAIDSDGYQASYSLGTFKLYDTIEELCDEFVVISEHQKKPHTIFKIELEDYIRLFTSKEKSADKIIAIYGSIWVEGDLHKVAKMNDKGELELL